jgi:transposase
VRKVDLSMEEQNKFEVIKKLVETGGNKLTASVKLDCTIRTINRMIAGYKQIGKAYFIHGNTGRQPALTLNDGIKEVVVDLYKTKYYGANFTHFIELLAEHEKINISETTLRTILMSQNILSPKATKKVRKRIKKVLEEMQKQPGLSTEEKKHIIQTIIDIEDAHPRRPRCANFGELIQMDASVHIWFGDLKCYLHIAVDDSTGSIIGAYFDTEETLNGYYNLLFQILTNYGIPYKFLTDKRTVFEYKLKESASVEDDTFTQFGYACKQLGIEIQTSSIPQAKGRVERMFQTLQSRLPLEMKLAGVTDITRANEFLNSYIKKFNAKFSLPIDHNKSVFEKQPSLSQINLTLAVLAERKIDDGHCIRYNKKYFKTVDEKNNPVYHRKGTEALVIKAFDGTLYASISDNVYALDEIPIRETFSKNFDARSEIEEQVSKDVYIPPITHPWKGDSFKSYQRKQAHLKQKLSDELSA